MANMTQSGHCLRDTVSFVLEWYGVSHKKEHTTNCFDDLQKRIRVDLYVYGTVAYPHGLYIQCRWQQSSGTTDEKIHSEIRKARQCLDKPTVIVLDGKATDRGREFAADSIRGNLAAVMTLAEFLAYAPMLSSTRGATQLRRIYEAEQMKLFGA